MRRFIEAELGRLLNWKVTRLRASEYSVYGISEVLPRAALLRWNN